MKQILKRYRLILKAKVREEYPHAVITIKAMPGDETNDIHLLWMIDQIRFNKEQSKTQKHRWLGYIQGIMVFKTYINVTEERQLTRAYLNND